MEYLVIIALGLVVGFLSSFFGIGGGSLIVPVLYIIYPKLPASVIIPISLGTIFIITCVNTARFYKLNLLPPKNITLNFILTCSIGGIIGANLLYLTDTETTKKIMGVVILISVLKILFLKSSEADEMKSTPSAKLIGSTGFLGSLISSITGLGGGIIFTPMLINVVKLPMKLVSPYSNLAMVVATLLGTAPHLFKTLENDMYFTNPMLNKLFIGNVNLGIIILLVSTAIVSSMLGIKFNNSIHPSKKKLILATLMLILSIRMILA